MKKVRENANQLLQLLKYMKNFINYYNCLYFSKISKESFKYFNIYGNFWSSVKNILTIRLSFIHINFKII